MDFPRRERGWTSGEGNGLRLPAKGTGLDFPRRERGWTSGEGHPGRKVKKEGDRLSRVPIECCNVSFLARPRRRVVLVWELAMTIDKMTPPAADVRQQRGFCAVLGCF